MSSVAQGDDNQSSDVLLSFWECDKFGRRGSKEKKSAGSVDSE